VDPEAAAAARAAQTARVNGDREAEAARMGRLVPITDAEVAEASAQPRDYPAPDPAEVARWRQEQADREAAARERERIIEPEARPETGTPHIDPDAAAADRAAQAARVQAEREARHEASARHTPVTDAEVSRYGVRREAEPEAGADEASRWNTYLAGVHAQMDAEARDLALRCPVTDAEMEAAAAADRADAEVGQDRADLAKVREAERIIEPEPEPEPEPAAEVTQADGERSAALAGLREDLNVIGAKVNKFVQQDAERAAKRAEMTQAAIDEPVIREPQAEPSLEASWQPGDAQGQYETQAESDYEPEMEL